MLANWSVIWTVIVYANSAKFAQVKMDRARKLVEKQKSTPTIVKDRNRGSFTPYCFSQKTASSFIPQR